MEHDTQIADEGSRQSLQAMWSYAAPAWGIHADYVDARERPVTAAMLKSARLARGMSVLELGCGPGGAGLAAAEVVGSDGMVVCSDIAQEMIIFAEQRAKRRLLDNVITARIDLERIDYPQNSFDAVLCRHALMLVADPAHAVRESHRVLRPGGRAVFTVWGRRERNPWLDILLDAVENRLGTPVPPPGVPGPFALSDEGALELLLHTAGFEEISSLEVATPLRIASVDEWWASVPALAGPVAQLLQSLPAPLRVAIRDDAAAAISQFPSANGFELPGLSIVASGRRPATRLGSAGEAVFRGIDAADLPAREQDSLRGGPGGSPWAPGAHRSGNAR
jgi:SAM-dependent methyltransferase